MKNGIFTFVFYMWLILGSATSIAAVPGQVNYQGVLLDNTNQLVNGTADFYFAIYDAPSGGTLLWSESQTGVIVSGGTYSIALGGVTPIDAGVLSDGNVYLEVTVDGSTLSPRHQLLAVPYALEADVANNVGGVGAEFITQLWENTDYDGESQANNDPEQGLDDVDEDGLANFMDPDNDGDGFNDDTEISNGTNVNLVTPNISSISPDAARVGQNTTFTINGEGFLPGITVQAGTETAVVQSVTSTSIEVTLGSAQTTAGSITITANQTNSESGTTSVHFYDKTAFVTSAIPASALEKTAAEADAVCATAASSAGLSGTFMAWYSSVVGGGPAFRWTGGGAWANLAGELVAANMADLTDGNISAKINVDENGNTLQGGGYLVATNVSTNGNSSYARCTGTGSSPTVGTIGSYNETGGGWTSYGTLNCNVNLRYYCFEQ